MSWIKFPSRKSLDGGTPLSIILFVPEWRLQIHDPRDVINRTGEFRCGRGAACCDGTQHCT